MAPSIYQSFRRLFSRDQGPRTIRKAASGPRILGPVFELEDRTAPAVDIPGSSGVDGFVVKISETDFTVLETYQNGVLIDSRDFASTSALAITGADGDDVLTVDFTHGNPVPAGGISFDGGVGGNDGLVVIGNGAGTAVYTPSASVMGDGVVTVVGAGAITFTGLEPVDITGFAVATVGGLAGNNNLSVTGGTAFFTADDAIIVSGTTNGGTPIEAVAFWNNNTVLIDTTGSPGTDLVTIDAAGTGSGHLNNNLTINTGTDPADLIVVNGVTTFSGLTTLEAPTINLNADITNAVIGATATLVNVDDAPSGQVQDGVNVAAPNAIVNVIAGYYPENVTIATAITLQGPNVGINPNTTPRVGEAIIDGGFGDALTITPAGTVVIDGLTVLGNYGVFSSTADLDVQNNILGAPIYGYGVYVSTSNGSVDVIDNKVNSFGFGVFASTVAGDVTVQGNDFFGNIGLFGVEIASVSGALTIGGSLAGQGNTFTGTGLPVFSWVVGIDVFDTDDVTIEGNSFTDVLRGIWLQDSGIALNPADVVNNAMTATLPFDGGMVFDGATFVSATQNSVSGFGYGVYATLGADVNLQQNFLSGNMEGIHVDDAGPVVAYNNDLSGSISLAINNTGAGTVDASGNWFGTVNEALVFAATAGLVDFTPYLAAGTDITPLVPGFQGDFTALYVTALGAQVGSPARIQEGYNLLDGSLPDTLYVLSGSYVGGADFSAGIDKAVTVVTGAILSPGQVVLDGDFTLSSNDSFPVDIEGPNPLTDYDNWVVSGVVNAAITLNNATLPTLRGSYAPVYGDVFTIINNDNTSGIDPVVGTFAGYPAGSVVSPNTFPFFNGAPIKVFYTGNDGNDVILANALITKMYVDDNWIPPTYVPGYFIADADLGRIGNQPALFGLDGFKNINDGLPFLSPSGDIIVNDGTYLETVAITGTQKLDVTGPDVPGNVVISALSSTVNTTISMYGVGSLTVGDASNQTIAGLIDSPVLNPGGTLIKAGTGELTLSHANNYFNGTLLREGTLVHADELATGAVTAPITVNDGATVGATTLRFTTGVIDSNTGSVYKPITVAAGGTTTTFEFNQGAAYVDATLAISKPITITTTAGLTQLGLMGAISGTGDVTFGNTGVGTFTYTAGYDGVAIVPNSFVGNVFVTGSITTNNLNYAPINAGANGIIPDASSVTVSGGATWTLAFGDETFSALNGAGNFDNGGNDIIIGFANGSGATTGVLSGAGDLTKIGTGTQQLGGGVANTYSGATNITNGTLVLNKTGGITAIAGPAPITIGDGIGAAASAVLQIDNSEQIGNAINIALAGADARLFANLSTGEIETIAPINQLNPIPNDFRGGEVLVGNGIVNGGGTLAVTGNYTQGAPLDTPGATTLNGGTLRVGAGGINTYDLNTGILRGFGTVTTNLLNNFVTISPGSSATAGRITIQGNLDLKSTSVVNLEVGGTGAGQYDQLWVTLNPGLAAVAPTPLAPFSNGAVFFRGTLNVDEIGLYTASNLDSFDSMMAFEYRLLNTDTLPLALPAGYTNQQGTDFTTKNLNQAGPGIRYDSRFLNSTNGLNAMSQASNAAGNTWFAAIPSIGAAKKLNLTALATLATSVTPSISINRGGITTNTNTRHQNQNISITNVSGLTISGPLYLEVTITSGSGIQLFNKSGLSYTSGSTKAYVVLNTTSLAPGATATVQLEWSNPNLTPFTFDINILAGGLP